MNITAENLLIYTLLLLLVVLFPILGVRDYRQFLRELRAGDDTARLRFYNRTIVWLWSPALAFTAWWLVTDGSVAALRLAPVVHGWQWAVIAAGIVAGGLVLYQMTTVRGDRKQLEQLRGQSGDLCDVAPKTVREQRAWDLVSITAGICEEILYRGLLLTILAAITGLWPAVALSSIVFGLAHAYQGMTGILKTSGVGLVLALLAIGSGSLFLPMVLHAVVDMTSGRMIKAAAATTTGARSRAASTTPAGDATGRLDEEDDADHVM